MATLSRRERVIVGAGAMVALVVGGYLFLVEPLLMRARDAEALVPAREATLERRRLLVSQRPRLAEELAAVDDGLGRELLAAHPLPPPPVPRPARPVALTAAAATATPPPSGAAHGVIAAKNLFSPSRSEAQAGLAVAAGPKPVLHGVVMDGPKSRAYL